MLKPFKRFKYSNGICKIILIKEVLIMKKGQGLPLNTIIIAIIVLVVLVVIIAIFTGRIAIFEQQVSEQSKIELIRVRPSYAACHPTASEEQNFLSKLDGAVKSGDVNEQAEVRSEFQDLIGQCSALSESNCRGGCTAVKVG